MDDRQLIADLLSALEYHTEQTRPIEFSKVAIEAAREYLQNPAQQEPVCQWQREDDDHMPDTWRSDCGVLWTFTDGGPVDNDMHFCPNCGKPAIEAAHGIKENT